MEKKPAPKKIIPPHLRFVFGGLSGMIAICAVQPLDLIKTRLQLLGPESKKTTVFVMARQVVRKAGVKGLYAGLSAALFRQATYTAGRLGSFNYFTDLYTPVYGVPSFGVKLLLGVAAGSVGAVVGNPAEVALVRMTADGHLPPEQRRNYTNVFNAITRMVREEGPTSLLSGMWVTIYRAAVLNAAQLGTYAQAREVLLPSVGEGVLLHVCSSMISGLITTVVTQPLDLLKTRIQNEARTTGAQVSLINGIRNVIQKEGVLGLWGGFLARFLKMWPQTVLTFVIFEQINAFYLRTLV